MPISETLGVVASEIPDPVGNEFRAVTDKMRIGRTMEGALQDTADRLGGMLDRRRLGRLAGVLQRRGVRPRLMLLALLHGEFGMREIVRGRVVRVRLLRLVDG